MKRTTFIQFILATATIGLAHASWAKNWYVDAGIVASGDGSSQATAFRSIQEALQQSSSGDTIWASAGKYAGPIQMKDGVNLLGAGAMTTTIEGSGPFAVVIGANNCQIDDFTIRGDGQLDIDGIYCEKTKGFVISRNIIASHSWSGVSVRESDVSLVSNLIISNRCAGIWCEGQSLLPIQIVHNTICGNHNEAGINLWHGASATLVNNIITGNTGYGGILCNENGQVNLERNNVWGNSCIQGSSTNYWGCLPGTSDISVDPRFVDWQCQDYRLRHNSDCIDVGFLVSPDLRIYCQTDLAGTARPVNLATADLGCYEATPLKIETIEFKTNQGVQLSWSSLPGETYGIETNPGLDGKNWQEISRVTSRGEMTEWTDLHPMSPMQLYRIEMLP